MFLEPDASIDRAVLEIGSAIFRDMSWQRPVGLFSRKGLYRRLMEWSMRDPEFKTELFRFVDVLPSLRSDREVVQLLEEYLGKEAGARHGFSRGFFRIAAWMPAVAAALVRLQMRDMARQFVAGETPGDLIRHFYRNADNGMATTVDLLGEAVVSSKEADFFLQRNLEILDALSVATRRRPRPAFSDLGLDGMLPRIHLSVKISALSPDIRVESPETSVIALAKRLRPILRKAKEVGAFVNFDMESTSLKEITLTLFRSILEEPEFASGPEMGIALQAYLKSCETDLLDLMAWARTRGKRIGIRLVKGAYWDYETTLARQRNWPVPVWEQKAASDACYEKLSLLLLENMDTISPAFASHNVRSVAHVIAQARRLNHDPRSYEFQALFGMADDLKAALLKAGYRVREYCPVGELLPGMAYLVRRLLENTSNEEFLRARASGTAEITQLLENPVKSTKSPRFIENAPNRFRNVPNTDFTIPENRERIRKALQILSTRAPQWPLVIGGKRQATARRVESVNPANPSQIVGYWSRATIRDAENALTAARSAWPAWAATPVERRAAILERAADLMQEERFELAAVEILEAGKPWVEADADVSEAIDFCRFYAQEMRHLDSPGVTQQLPGEDNRLAWTPRGTGVIIAPWNFPLAILCGLTVAPIVSGNTVVIKPAEQTSIIAAIMMDLLERAGLPPGVANLLTGDGEEVGAHLVAHPQIDFIAFTGSRAVGSKIWETAAITHPGQSNLKKVVCEMGGKNALIIDTSADLDEAIPAALHSAFGYSGQKCSALSRLIVLKEVHEKFVSRFISAAAELPTGDPADPKTVVGPVIDEEAQQRILAAIERGRKEATLAWQGQTPEQGYFVPPTIFTDVAPGTSLGQDEIFGPVIAILQAKDLDEAFTIANGTQYALTGGIFSRTPRSLERARREFLVGNLYLNRNITGAIVERHPFGGFRMSGGGTKAGGRDYLKEFLFPRVISENRMRRGFSPGEE